MKNLLLLLWLSFVATIAVANNFVVTTNADSGPGSLRDAITQAAANGTATADLISFNIPYLDNTSITIQLISSLPSLSSNLTLDGTTQPSAALGVSDARIIIEPQGNNNVTAMLDSCLTLDNADNVQIYGLFIRNFYEFVENGTLREPAAVWLYNANNLVFGAPGKGNVIAGCSFGLFKAYSPGTTNNMTVQSSFFGVDVDGLTRLLPSLSYTNIVGVEITLSTNAKIGGNTAAEGNLFSGNVSGVAFIEVSGAVEVGNNKFNTDYTGNTELGVFGTFGARDGSASFFIHDNIIAGETEFSAMSGRFLVTNNFFGTNPSQTVQFTSAGGILDFNNCTGQALIGGNDASTMNVFGNGVLGVGNNNSSKITVLHNSFYCHQNDGIYMNWYTLPNKPFITINSLTATSAAGTSRPNSIIELYQTDACNHCEGKTFIARLNSDASGRWTYNGPVGTLTGTATNTDDSTTSAFAQPLIDVSQAVVTDATCNKSNGKIIGIHISSGTRFTWTDNSGTVVGNDTNLINVPAGQYQLSVAIGSDACKAISQAFTVGNTAPPAINDAAFSVTQPSCGGFNGSVAYTDGYTPNSAVWLNSSGQVIQQGSTLTHAGEGDYTFRLVTAADPSCYSNSSPISLTNQSGPTVNISDAQVTAATCNQHDGSITNIRFSNITGTAVYYWYDSLNNLAGSSADLTNVAAGSYYLKFKDQGPCDTITTSAFFIARSGAVQLDISAEIVAPAKCSAAVGGISNISVGNGATFTWIDAGTRAIISMGQDLTGVPSGYYKLIATSSTGCSDSTGRIFVPEADPAPVIQSGSAVITPDICTQQNGSISQVSVQGSGPFTYAWFNASDQHIAQTKDLADVAPGSYYLVITDPNHCADTSTLFVVNAVTETIPSPVYNDVIILRGTPASLVVANHDMGRYSLYATPDAVSADQSNLDGVFLTGPIQNDTTLYVVLTKGTCSSPLSPAKIHVVDSVELAMPNAFTPNSDGRNDVFRVKYPALIKTIRMSIFNRWGERMFETANPEKGWDGTLNGVLQPMGNYVYIINYIDILGNKRQLSGNVLLLR